MSKDLAYGPKTQEGKDFIEKLRLYMMDFAEINELLGKEESSTENLILATEMMLSDINAQPPLIRKFSLGMVMGQGLLSVALKLAASHVLDMKLQWQERNFSQYSDGTKTESVNDKAENYRRTSSMLKGEALNALQGWKISYNVKSGFYGGSGVHSVYSGSDFII